MASPKPVPRGACTADSPKGKLVASEAISTSSDEPSLAETRPAKPLPPLGRVWPILVILGVFWVFELSVYYIEMAAFTRFISRWIVYGVLFLVFMTWWLTYRGFRLRERLLAVVAMFGLAVAAGFLSHKSVAGPLLVMLGFPYCMTTWALWVAISRYWSLNVRRFGLLAVMALTFAYFPLIRWEGLNGRQQAEISWRWETPAEEVFQAERNQRNSAPVSSAGSGSESTLAQAAPWTLQPGDWPEFRGAGRTGVIEGVTLDATTWNTQPPKLVWKQRVGPGWSSVIVVDGHLVTQEQRGEKEVVVCYDSATGNELWVHEDALRFDEALSGPGPRATPTYADRDGGRIYTLGSKGKFNCLAARTGEVVWSKEIAEEAEATVPQWGYSVSPLVVDNLVVVHAGGENGKSILAYHADTGKLVWKAAGGSQTYSSPQRVKLGGVDQILVHDNAALWSLAPIDGHLLWQLDGKSDVALPQLQPWVRTDSELIVASEPGIALVQVIGAGSDAWGVSVTWDTRALKPAFNSFVVHEDHIYGLDDGILVCVDAATGERQWKKGRYGHGQVLLMRDQGALLIVGEKGELALVQANAA
jgi:outer membrane protein assembly factor BamB